MPASTASPSGVSQTTWGKMRPLLSFGVAVKEWRELNYFGASDTTRELLAHWFERPHRLIGGTGEEFDFRYYFCQREAIETFIYLIEVRGMHSLSSLIFEFGGPNAETEALGIKPEDDEWARSTSQIFTGCSSRAAEVARKPRLTIGQDRRSPSRKRSTPALNCATGSRPITASCF